MEVGTVGGKSNEKHILEKKSIKKHYQKLGLKVNVLGTISLAIKKSEIFPKYQG